jgi:NADH:ubiquinone oxidoreductase subunit 3 (subunit A)
MSEKLGDICLVIAFISSIICLFTLWVAYVYPKSVTAHYEIMQGYVLVAMFLVVIMTICFLVSIYSKELREKKVLSHE